MIKMEGEDTPRSKWVLAGVAALLTDD